MKLRAVNSSKQQTVFSWKDGGIVNPLLIMCTHPTRPRIECAILETWWRGGEGCENTMWRAGCVWRTWVRIGVVRATGEESFGDFYRLLLNGDATCARHDHHQHVVVEQYQYSTGAVHLIRGPPVQIALPSLRIM
jgi:hypothetical protein